MKALMLAAGASTRLYPLTSDKPKCLLPIGGSTLLEHQVVALRDAGIMELVIVVGYHQERIREHVAEIDTGSLSVTLLPTETYATTGPILGGLTQLVPHLTGTVLFLHCDVLVREDAVRSLIESAHATAMLYRPGTWDEEAGKIVVDTSGKVVELGKHIPKDRASGEYLQIAKFGNDFCGVLTGVVNRRAASHADGFTIEAFDECVRNGVIAHGLPYDGLAMEIDTPEDYEAAKAAWNRT